jgi:hypothetical protein
MNNIFSYENQRKTITAHMAAMREVKATGNQSTWAFERALEIALLRDAGAQVQTTAVTRRRA